MQNRVSQKVSLVSKSLSVGRLIFVGVILWVFLRSTPCCVRDQILENHADSRSLSSGRMGPAAIRSSSGRRGGRHTCTESPVEYPAAGCCTYFLFVFWRGLRIHGFPMLSWPLCFCMVPNSVQISFNFSCPKKNSCRRWTVADWFCCSSLQKIWYSLMRAPRYGYSGRRRGRLLGLAPQGRVDALAEQQIQIAIMWMSDGAVVRAYQFVRVCNNSRRQCYIDGS